MSKHTPGPWTAREAYDNGEPCGMVIGPMEYDLVMSLEDENIANAKLIALAPAMFDALLALLTARKESTEAFRRRSYKPDVQTVFDLVEREAGEE